MDPQIIVSVHAPFDTPKPHKVGLEYELYKQEFVLGFWMEWKVK